MVSYQYCRPTGTSEIEISGAQSVLYAETLHGRRLRGQTGSKGWSPKFEVEGTVHVYVLQYFGLQKYFPSSLRFTVFPWHCSIHTGLRGSA